MSPLLALVLAFATLLDGHGHPIPIREAIRVVIASVADTPLEAAELFVLVSHESAGRVDVRGDSGKSCGAWQTPCAETPMDGPQLGLRQARKAVDILRRAAVGCPEHPIWMYASGRCVPSDTARRYEREVSMLLDKATVEAQR